MKSKTKDFVTHSHKEIHFNLETHTFDIWIFRPDNFSSNPQLNKTYGPEGQERRERAGMLYNLS